MSLEISSSDIAELEKTISAYDAQTTKIGNDQKEIEARVNNIIKKLNKNNRYPAYSLASREIVNSSSTILNLVTFRQTVKLNVPSSEPIRARMIKALDRRVAVEEKTMAIFERLAKAAQ